MYVLLPTHSHVSTQSLSFRGFVTPDLRVIIISAYICMTMTGSTTDIAIWSTVEVGVGITAGCAATLRPLLKLVLAKAGISSSGHGSGMPWTQSNLQRAGYQRSIGLDDLRRDGMPGGATTTTTIVGGGSSKQASRTLRGQGSDEELIGISKDVVVTYTTETELEPRRDRESITRMSD